MDIKELPKIAKAVNRWLSYQILCGRETLLSEAYLGHPLVEYLLHRHSGELNTEVNHPVLNNPGPGRPRQIDYVLQTRDNAYIEVAIECKWIANTPYDRQRIVNDLLRLECIRVPGRHVKRFLLIAGLKENFEANFRNLQINAGGSRRNFSEKLLQFGMKNPDKTIQIRECESRFRALYKVFSESFRTEIPNSFKTTLLERGTADEVSVYIWQVSSVQNRRTFSPEDEWPDR